MAIRIKRTEAKAEGPDWSGFPAPSKTKAVRADLDKLHAGKLSGDQLVKRWGVPDLSRLHSWAYRVE